MFLSDAIASYLEGATLGELTKRKYRKALLLFLMSLGDLQLSQYNLDHVRLYKTALKSSAPIVRVKYLTALRSFFRWWYENSETPVLDYRRIHIERPTENHWGCFSLEQIEALRKIIGAVPSPYIRARDSTIFEVLYSTGLRREELRLVKLTDIDWLNSSIEVTGKGGARDTVYLSPTATQVVKSYLNLRSDQSPYLLASQGNVEPRSISGNLIQTRFALWGQKSGLVKCHPHMLRKSFATHLRQSGADYLTVNRLARHRDINTTKRYILVNDAEDKEAHTMYHGSNRRLTFEEKRQGKILIKAEIYCDESVSLKKAKQAMKEAIIKLLD